MRAALRDPDATVDEPTVLHVLPHPGGGGETYVDALARIDGFCAERTYLARGADDRDLGAIALRAGRVLRTARRFSIVHVHGEVAATLCLPVLLSRPSVVTLHGLHLTRRLTGARLALARVGLWSVMRAASCAICVSESEYRDVEAAVGRRTGSRAVVIRNGVRLPRPATRDERRALRAELGLAFETLVGVVVGSLDERKNPLTPARAAVDLAATGQDVSLLFLGDGPLAEPLRQLSRTGSAIRVIGFRDDVARFLRAADFFVLPSYREGLPFALLEAMSHGLPAVVSEEPGNVEAVGDCGVVVRAEEVPTFRAAFEQLSDASLRDALGRRARERVARFFGADEMLSRTAAVYAELVGRRDGR